MILTNNRIIISKAGEIPTGNTNPANETQSYMTLLPQLAPKQGEKMCTSFQCLSGICRIEDHTLPESARVNVTEGCSRSEGNISEPTDLSEHGLSSQNLSIQNKHDIY